MLKSTRFEGILCSLSQLRDLTDNLLLGECVFGSETASLTFPEPRPRPRSVGFPRSSNSLVSQFFSFSRVFRHSEKRGGTEKKSWSNLRKEAREFSVATFELISIKKSRKSEIVITALWSCSGRILGLLAHP